MNAMKTAACQQVALDAVKGLENAFLLEHVSYKAPALQRKHRQERLARKDAVPHLCSILRAALSSHREALLESKSPRSLYLASSTLDKLSTLQFALFSSGPRDNERDLLRGRSDLGVVAEDALLSVIEFAWMCCPIDERVEEAEDGGLEDVHMSEESQPTWWDIALS
ncbi:hypothetical protein DACRYDRAFT_112678 [Dacryopinax primogenitus]|uniref:Uncharacterized protein n=1 Tax=Dacryopinax primogenitus (strain DJM 731) TaxID=1858805 RepID=M5FNS2_DACPD|nr:uncharacterized protein DACRYDRAFT_112678 [Dacryopinax primogenitus]EJT96528.1 hypothetical protein DACRYDRAFT_112678 [Dacryopinax primogenitus]